MAQRVKQWTRWRGGSLVPELSGVGELSSQGSGQDTENLIFEDLFEWANKSEPTPADMPYSNDVDNFQWQDSGSVVPTQLTKPDGSTGGGFLFRYLGTVESGASGDDAKFVQQNWHAGGTQSPTPEVGWSTICFSYYLKIPSNYRHDNPDGGTVNNKLWAIWCDEYSDSGSGSTCLTERDPEDGGAGSDCHGQVSPGNFTVVAGDTGSYSDFITSDDYGKWYQLAVRLDIANDHFEQWVRKQSLGGTWGAWVKTQDFTSEPMKPADGSGEGSVGFHSGYLMGYLNSPYEEDTDFLLTDWRLGTTLASVAWSIEE